MEAVVLDFTLPSSIRIQSFISSFAEGLTKGGFLVHKYNLNDFKIMDCKGCTEDIMFVPNGECKCEDDFTKIYPQINVSEVLVFAVDLSSRGLLESLSKVLTRFEPVFKLNFNGSSESPQKKVFSLLFSPTNYKKVEVIEQLLEEFTQLYNYENLGNALRTNYKFLEIMPESIVQSIALDSDYFNLAYDLAKNKKVNHSLLEKVQRNFTPEDSLIKEILSIFKNT